MLCQTQMSQMQIRLKRIKSNQEHFYLWSFILEVDWFLFAVPVPVCDFLPRSTDTNRSAPIFKGDAEWRGASSTLKLQPSSRVGVISVVILDPKMTFNLKALVDI